MGIGPVKTWSLIVTILGDLAADEGARIPGPVLTRLTGPMGLKPEALRVALHRLRRDGWIASERDGRTSLYELTAHGRNLTRSVSDRVYGTEPPAPDDWHVLIAPSAEAMQALELPDLIQLGPRSALLSGPAQGLPGALLAWRVEPGTLPQWASEIVTPPELAAAYGALARAVKAAMEAAPSSLTERTVLRLAALHQWRRLVLRHGPGPEALMGELWDGALARVRIGAMLELFARPAIADLAGEADS